MEEKEEAIKEEECKEEEVKDSKEINEGEANPKKRKRVEFEDENLKRERAPINEEALTTALEKVKATIIKGSNLKKCIDIFIKLLVSLSAENALEFFDVYKCFFEWPLKEIVLVEIRVSLKEMFAIINRCVCVC